MNTLTPLPEALVSELTWHLEHSVRLVSQLVGESTDASFTQCIEDAKGHLVDQLPSGYDYEDATLAQIQMVNDNPSDAITLSRDLHDDLFGVFTSGISTDVKRNAGTVKITTDGLYWRDGTLSDDVLKSKRGALGILGKYALQIPKAKYRGIYAHQPAVGGISHVEPGVKHFAPKLENGAKRLFIRKTYNAAD